MVGIYKITSPSNKVYIGLSKDIKARWRGYSIKKKTAPQQPKLYYSFKKYGVENHKFEVLEECKFEDLSKREVYYIKKYNSVNEGLNVSSGGYNFWEVNVGKKHTKETIAKMKEYWAENAKPRSNKTISKISKTKQQNPRITTPEMIEKFRNTSTSKKSISQFDLEGNHIKDFNSINEAARHLSIRNDGISACLRKKQKTAYGFIWKYQK